MAKMSITPFNRSIVPASDGNIRSNDPFGLYTTLQFQHDSLYFLNFEDSSNRLKDITTNNSTSSSSGVTFGSSSLDANSATFAGAGKIDLTGEIGRFSGLRDFSASVKVRFTSLTGVQVILGFSDATRASTDWLLFAENNNLTFQVRNSAGTIQFKYVITAGLSTGTNYTISCSSGDSGPKLWINSTFYAPATYVTTGSPTSTASLDTVAPTNAYIGANKDSFGDEYFLNGSVKDIVYSNSSFNDSTVTDIVNEIYGYDVIALWGQSNQVGRPSIRSGIDNDYSAISSLVSQFGFDSQTVGAATNPLDHQDEHAGDMGQWRTFCVQLVNSLVYKRKILVSPAAKGGTGFKTNNWNVGDAVYEAALASTNAAMAVNKLNTLRCMHWIQGETDADNSSTTYEADLTAMMTDAYSRLTGFSSSIPFIAVSIKGSSVPAYVSIINTALQSFVSKNAKRGYVDATDLTLFDTFHYDAASLAEIGTRSFTKLVEIA